MVREEILADLECAEKLLNKKDHAIVVIRNNEVILTNDGVGIRPLYDVLNHLGSKGRGCIIGSRILGKASAFLCVHAQVGGVFSCEATKTAIAILIRAGIPGQADKLIEYVRNESGTGMCPFEQMLDGVELADEAHAVVSRLLGNNSTISSVLDNEIQ